MELTQNKKILLFLTSGAVCGILFGMSLPELIHMGSGSYAGFSSLYSLGKFQYTEVNPAELFLYVAFGRIRTLFLLWMSIFTPAGLIVHVMYLFWLGMSGGMLLSLYALRDGYEGILLFLCCIFPQWIFYAGVWKREIRFLMNHSGGRRISDGYSISVLPFYRAVWWELLLMTGLCTAGAAAESFLGIWTLKIFLKMTA